MTDQQTTPSPGNVSPEDGTARAPAEGAEQATAQKVHSKATRSWLRRKRFSLPLAVTLLFLIIMISTGGNDPGIFDLTTSALESKIESVAKLTTATATIGQSVRDGKFAFIVTSVKPPNKFLTDRLGTTETAQGEIVIVRVNVTNIGYEARTLTATDQFLVSNKGQRFATSAAISSLEGSEKILLEKINPGHMVNDAPLLFDVQPGTTIAYIELHDSVSSTGVKVKLR